MLYTFSLLIYSQVVLIRYVKTLQSSEHNSSNLGPFYVSIKIQAKWVVISNGNLSLFEQQHLTTNSVELAQKIIPQITKF